MLNIDNDDIKHYLDKYHTPFFIFNFNHVKDNYNLLTKQNVQIYYAVKANPNIELLKILYNIGSFFDVASRGEINELLKINVDGSHMSYGNPNKKELDIEYAYQNGVKIFSVDNKSEIDKISRVAPNSNVFIRIILDGINSVWPLSEKFGQNDSEQIDLIEYALSKNINPMGVSFHVGSQNEDVNSWIIALNRVANIYNEIYIKHNIKLSYINIGGGFPVQYDNYIPSETDILTNVNEELKNLFDWDIKIFIEPGRYLQADLGILVTSVISTSIRKNKKWIYLDAGIYSGLLEQLGGLQYPVTFLKQYNGQLKNSVLAGPTCDSMDVINKDIMLPEDVNIGDIVILHTVGQYSIDLLTEFNGFAFPDIIIQ